MQFTLIDIYIYIYILTILILLFLIVRFTPIILFVEAPIHIYLSFLKKYSIYYIFIILLLFSLAGLPIALFFFIKINFFFFLLEKLDLFSIIVLIINFIFSTFYYLQLFNNKNFNTDLISFLNLYIFSQRKYNSFKVYKYRRTYQDFNFLQLVVFFIFFLYFGFLYFFDFVLIISIFT